MEKYVCDVCGYVYDEAAGDPDNGIAPGTRWEDLPEDFLCPLELTEGRGQGYLGPDFFCRHPPEGRDCLPADDAAATEVPLDVGEDVGPVCAALKVCGLRSPSGCLI
mgnify:CR=1 FL=1